MTQKLLFLIPGILLFITIDLTAQNSQAIRIDKLDSKYVILYGDFHRSIFTYKVHSKILIDFGQTITEKKDFVDVILDENGMVKYFTTMANALNYFNQYGYEVLHFENQNIADGMNRPVYVLEKRTAKDENVEKLEAQIIELKISLDSLNKHLVQIEKDCRLKHPAD